MEIIKRKTSALAINITPLIDVVFLLLIFFMLTSTFIKEKSIALSLPESSEAKTNEKNDITTVSVKKNGTYFIGSRELTFTELQTEIEKIYNDKPESSVILRMEKDSEIQLFVSAMDMMKGVGIESVSLATQE